MLILAIASAVLVFCFVSLYFENKLPFKHVLEKKIGLNTTYFGGMLMNESGQEMNEKWLSELYFQCRIRSIALQTIMYWHLVLIFLKWWGRGGYTP
jgi:hypothetical protein